MHELESNLTSKTERITVTPEYLGQLHDAGLALVIEVTTSRPVIDMATYEMSLYGATSRKPGEPDVSVTGAEITKRGAR